MGHCIRMESKKIRNNKITAANKFECIAQCQQKQREEFIRENNSKRFIWMKAQRNEKGGERERERKHRTGRMNEMKQHSKHSKRKQPKIDVPIGLKISIIRICIGKAN